MERNNIQPILLFLFPATEIARTCNISQVEIISNVNVQITITYCADVCRVVFAYFGNKFHAQEWETSVRDLDRVT